MAHVPIVYQFQVGRGFNSTTGDVYGTAIEFDEPQPATDQQGQNQVLVLEGITSSRQLSQKMSFGVSASVNSGNWGGSTGYKLTQLREISSYYTYALIRSEVQNPPLLLRNPRLKAEAKQKLEDEGWDAFAETYGWEYFEGYVSGGSYFALIEIQTKSELTQRDVLTKLSGYYGPLGASSGAEQALKEISQHTSINVFVSQSGGDGDPIETTLETMVDQARTFADLARRNPVPIFGLTSDYKKTIALPDIPAADSLARIQQRNTIEDLGRKYLRLRDYKGSLEFVLDNFINFDEFRALEPEKIESSRKKYASSLKTCSEELDAIVLHATNCTANLNQCSTYVTTTNYLSLPTIEGDLLNLKQLEEKLATVSSELEALKQGKLQGVDTVGDIKMGSTITSQGRMHIYGGEALYLLNRSGVVIGKEWGGDGNLSVQGEIQGKLWISNVFTLVVPGNGAKHTVRMHPADKCIAFITSVSGSFQGGGERVWVEVGVDGFWYLCGHSQQPDVMVEARCAGAP